MGWHFGKAIDRHLRMSQVKPQIALAHFVLGCEVFAGVLLSGKMFNLRMFGGFSLSWNKTKLKRGLRRPQPLRLCGFGDWLWRLVPADFLPS